MLAARLLPLNLTGGANQLPELTYDRTLNAADDVACLPRPPAAFQR